MSGDDDSDKSHEPSQKKLDDARKRGEIPRSTDVTTAAAYFGFVLTAAAFGAAALKSTGGVLYGLLENADRLSVDWFDGSGSPMSGGLMAQVLMSLVPWFMIPALFVVATLFATRSFVFATDRVQPKLSKISMVSNAKNKFGRSGLFEFAKSFFKLSIYSIVVGFYLWTKIPEMVATMTLSPGMITVELLQLGLGFFAIVLAISIVIGGVDYLFQFNEHLRKNRMSHKELRDEAKDQDGDPHMKQKRRQKGYDIAMNQMLGDVPEADVIIVNPTHYAVALKWDRLRGGAPVCVAKGVDDIAATIREIATENDIPIHRDPPTARAIYATVDIGQEIWPEHYPAVAASIRFAEEMRTKMRAKRKAGF
ncbi:MULTISPECIES: EscU/YscU/HrcU family type III secretion system export apparatus switch protein [Alphaproteobacteria]|uniref:EscU/YscU/HrcU family type III secretion system export apparatus switch protein n=1 Tax=Alphaproteobacteria TaxID=28211 RepID=UPI003A943B39